MFNERRGKAREWTSLKKLRVLVFALVGELTIYQIFVSFIMQNTVWVNVVVVVVVFIISVIIAVRHLTPIHWTHSKID